MTSQPDIWKALAEPFPDDAVKQRPGRGNMTFSYVDARAVMQRLDDVLTPAGWDFTSAVIPGTDIVKGTLTIASMTREDYGYPNSDHDEEPVKAASSDALKRCAVMFGIGRHLYGDNKAHTSGTGRVAPPARPAAAPRTSTEMPEFPDDFGDAAPAKGDNTNCPIHDVPWVGEWGDLWHKDPDGKYCRHPENTRRTGPRRAA